MISVIITTFNRSERLKKAIESVFKQTYQEWELIIVDDASTDDTEKVIESFNSHKITYFKMPSNYGSDTKPKNQGVLLSNGEYIAFLDDDNTWRPDHLAVLLKAIESDPRLDVVYGDHWAIDETGGGDRAGIAMDYNPSFLLKRNYIDTSDVLVKRDALFDVGGFDENYKKYIDWNLWLRMSKAGKNFQRVPLIITDYHLHFGMKSDVVKDSKSPRKDVFIPEWDPWDCEIKLGFLGLVEEPRVAIYTLTYDRMEYTKRAFASLRKTAGYEFDHYIYDNGSTDKTPKFLKQYQKDHKGVHYILSPDNKGISIASNRILDEIVKDKYDIIMKVDNDCLFLTEGWLKSMVDIYKSNHRLALSCYVQGLLDNPGGAPRIGYGTIKGQLIGMTKHLGGVCHFVDASAYNRFRWSPDDRLHGMQDMEFSQYLIFNGFQMGYLENFYCEHMDGTEGQKKRYPDYFERRKEEKTKSYEK